jgi:hypothetical protein
VNRMRPESATRVPRGILRGRRAIVRHDATGAARSEWRDASVRGVGARVGFARVGFERAGFKRASRCKCEWCRARSGRRELAFRERVVSCAQRTTRARLPRASGVVRAADDASSPSKSEWCRARSGRRELAFRERVVSCAQRTTRAHAARSKHVARRLAEPRALRPSEARPDRTLTIHPKHRGATGHASRRALRSRHEADVRTPGAPRARTRAARVTRGSS